MKLNHPLPPLKLLLRKEYLYDGKKHAGEYVPCVLVSVKSLVGRALSFQVMCDNGVLRDKLPISAIVTKPCDTIDLNMLELWDNSSNNITVTKMPFLDMSVSYLRRDRTWHTGRYLFTVDFYETDLAMGWSEEASEHKCKHIIALDSGHLAAQPNNRLRFQEPSFIITPFPDKPDYHVATSFPSVEDTEKWVGDWHYDLSVHASKSLGDAVENSEQEDLGELLVSAIVDEKYEVAADLIARGANPNARGGVPLALAVENKHTPTIEALVKAGATWDDAERCIDKTDGKLVSVFTRFKRRFSGGV